MHTVTHRHIAGFRGAAAPGNVRRQSNKEPDIFFDIVGACAVRNARTRTLTIWSAKLRERRRLVLGIVLLPVLVVASAYRQLHYSVYGLNLFNSHCRCPRRCSATTTPTRICDWQSNHYENYSARAERSRYLSTIRRHHARKLLDEYSSWRARAFHCTAGVRAARAQCPKTSRPARFHRENNGELRSLVRRCSSAGRPPTPEI